MLHKERVRLFYVGSFLLNAPLFALYSMLQFILYKDLKATALQITLLISAKPLSAVFSSYWSSLVTNRQDRLKGNIIWASLIGVLPTFFFPFFQNSWFLLAGFALYFLSERAVIPAWMEILKLKLPTKEQSRTVSTGSLVGFIASALFPIIIAPWMDIKVGVWRGLFPLFGAISLLRIILHLSLTSLKQEVPKRAKDPTLLIRPWKTSWEVLRKRGDFAYYQLIFFFGGLGIMIMQPALPKFINDVLHLSYTELALAFALCKGLGFAVTNPFWSARISKINIYLFCSLVTLLAATSLILIICSAYFSLGIYLAFFCYGAMQAGSHLSWHLGGPIFSPTEDSSPYTSVNVMLVGIRGCIGPFVGGLLCSFFGLTLPFYIGSVLCLLGSAFGIIGYQAIPVKAQEL